VMVFAHLYRLKKDTLVKKFLLNVNIILKLELPEYIRVLYNNNDKIEEEDVSKKNEESKKQEIVTE